MTLQLASQRIRWLTLLLVGGCVHPVREQVDAVVCELAARPLDVQAPQIPPAPEKKPAIPADAQKPSTTKPGPSGTRPDFGERVRFPQDLPGAEAELKVPPPKVTPQERRRILEPNFKPLPTVEPGPIAQPGPFGHPLTLGELQQIAMANSPLVRQAATDVEAARGALRQAGAYPNPMFGYESDTAGTSGTAGFQGVFFEQLIKTGGKLKTAQASAMMSLLNSELALRRARSDVMTQVRGGYFAVLVAKQNVKWNEDLVDFTTRVYKTFLDQLLLGDALAPYEPLQLRAVAVQAQTTLTQARQRYVSAWKQLAATLGKPDMPITELAGQAEMAIPVFHPDEAGAHVLRNHTDVLTARNTQQKARYDLHATKIAPIPDVDVRVAVQKDFSMAPFGITHTIQIGVPIPIWDQNRGNIIQAQAALLRATEEEHRVRSVLSQNLADAFERYLSNANLVRHYRESVLPNFSVVYSRTVLRHATNPPTDASVASLDIITNQQLYLAAIATYASALRDQWQAVADVAGLLQLDDLFKGMEAPAVPQNRFLPVLPCSHPCDPLPNGPAPTWDTGMLPELLPAPLPEGKAR